MKLTEQDIKWYMEGLELLFMPDHLMRVIKEYPHTFITDPQYGFLKLFNKPDSPWQEGFWNWMVDRGYSLGTNLINPVGGEIKTRYEPILLTGYILEYLESDRGEAEK